MIESSCLDSEKENCKRVRHETHRCWIGAMPRSSRQGENEMFPQYGNWELAGSDTTWDSQHELLSAQAKLISFLAIPVQFSLTAI